MHSKVELELVGSMDHLRLVWQTGEALLESVEFAEDPEGSRYNVLLALQEMVTNVLRHGYGLDSSQPVQVMFELDDDRFVIEVRDRGQEFDPLAFDSQAAEGEDMPTNVGGFGIHIARMVMDDLNYERRDGWNCLRLSKDLHAKAGL
ncbi:MAG: ATP-binding protein [bacterium]|nr:ATP-binding protein [bacterium]